MSVDFFILSDAYFSCLLVFFLLRILLLILFCFPFLCLFFLLPPLCMFFLLAYPAMKKPSANLRQSSAALLYHHSLLGARF